MCVGAGTWEILLQSLGFREVEVGCRHSRALSPEASWPDSIGPSNGQPLPGKAETSRQDSRGPSIYRFFQHLQIPGSSENFGGIQENSGKFGEFRGTSKKFQGRGISRNFRENRGTSGKFGEFRGNSWKLGGI